MEGYLMGMFTTCLMLLEFKFACADRGRVYMVTSPESVVMPINDETVLTCEMNLLPDNFQWRHYPSAVQEASNMKSQIVLGTAVSIILPETMYTVEKKTSTLKIKSTNKTVAGDYQCLAHYGASVVASIPGRITLTTLQKFTPQSSLQVTVTVGNTLMWRCEPPISNPPAAIDFYKDSNYINPQMGIPLTQSLILPNVNVTDSGIYKCTANNIIEQSSQAAEFSLNLRVVNNGPIVQPKFLVTPQKLYTVNSGKTAFMECAAIGNPVPKVTWFKSNGALPTNRTELVPGGLRIFNVSSSDDGIYICNHTNSVGTLSHHITLFYNEAPTIIDGPRNVDVKEGDNLDLECIVKGTPEPYISWFVNGLSVVNDSAIEAIGNRIYFRPIAKRHAGILQCFVGNSVGTTYSSSNVKVIPKQISSNDGFDDLVPLPTASNHKRRKHKPKKNKGHKGSTEMIPPSRPTITRLNDESVMVRWTVPENNGLPIQFFKMQYRELGPVNHTVTHKGSKWVTTNADIPPHIRSYEVNSLNPDHYYRFRIAAVYSNNDNKLGPNSAKFHLNRTDFFLRNPLPVPRLLRTETVNETAIRIFWLYEPLPNVSIDGFFVHYLPADSASDYMKETVEGEHVRSYVIQHLQPSTMYDIKLQSFTTKSASEFTPIMKQSTSAGYLTHKKVTGANGVSLTSTYKPSPSLDSNGQMKMYIIIGAGIISIAVLLSVVVLVIVCLRKHKNKNVSQDDHVNKDDVSHHIQADSNDYVVGPKPTRMNGCITTANRMTITPNPLAEADNKNQNMIEMSCLSSQNNNCSQPSASTHEMISNNVLLTNKNIKSHRDKNKKLDMTNPRENYV